MIHPAWATRLGAPLVTALAPVLPRPLVPPALTGVVGQAGDFRQHIFWAGLHFELG